MTTRMTWCTRPRAGSPPPLFWTLPPRRTDVHEEVPRPRPPVCLQDISLLVRRSVSVCSDRAPWNFTFSKRQFVFFHRHVKMGWPIKGKACISFFLFLIQNSGCISQYFCCLFISQVICVLYAYLLIPSWCLLSFIPLNVNMFYYCALSECLLCILQHATGLNYEPLIIPSYH